jgi:hypothetical protein
MCDSCGRGWKTDSEGGGYDSCVFAGIGDSIESALSEVAIAIADVAGAGGPMTETDEMVGNLRLLLQTGRAVQVPVFDVLNLEGLGSGDTKETLRWHVALARLEQRPVWASGTPSRTFRLSIQEAAGRRRYSATIAERG